MCVRYLVTPEAYCYAKTRIPNIQTPLGTHKLQLLSPVLQPNILYMSKKNQTTRKTVTREGTITTGSDTNL